MRHRILESSKHKLPMEVPTTIVLIQWVRAEPNNDLVEFSSHVQCWGEGSAATGCAETPETDERNGLVSGNYFDNLQDALDDYNERATNHHNTAQRAKK